MRENVHCHVAFLVKEQHAVGRRQQYAIRYIEAHRGRRDALHVPNVQCRGVLRERTCVQVPSLRTG